MHMLSKPSVVQLCHSRSAWVPMLMHRWHAHHPLRALGIARSPLMQAHTLVIIPLPLNPELSREIGSARSSCSLMHLPQSMA